MPSSPEVSYTLRLSTPAQNDIARILEWTQTSFGDLGRTRYEKLIAAALVDLRTDPARAGVRVRDDIAPAVCSYALSFSRKRVTTADQIAKPRHLVLFRVKGEVVEVARLLHEAMDLGAQGV